MRSPTHPSHALQINRLVARSDEELALFEAEDARLKEAELAAWGSAAGGGGGGALYQRLAPAAEVNALVEAAEEQAAPADSDEDKEFGRGKRARGEVQYVA